MYGVFHAWDLEQLTVMTSSNADKMPVFSPSHVEQLAVFAWSLI